MKRPFMFATLAAIAAVLAGLIVFSALKKRDAEMQKALANTVEIVVASRDLPLGTRIDANSVRLVHWSQESVPTGSFTDPQALMNASVKSQFVANEPIVASKLFMGGNGGGGVMPMMIPPGMRAMSVPVDEVSDIAGFVLPRTHVDILLAVSADGPNTSSFSRMVLQNVEVLAVAQEIEGSKDQPQEVKVVTLLVSPADAEKLALAGREGTLRLAMRNFADSKTVATGGISLSELLHGDMLPVIQHQETGPIRAGRTAFNIQIMRDGKSDELQSFMYGGAPVVRGHHAAPVPKAAPSPSDSAGTQAVSQASLMSTAPIAAPATTETPPAAKADPGESHAAEPKTINIP